MAFEIPFEPEWIEAHAIGGVGRLEDKKHRNGVDRVFKSSAKKSGQMRAGQNPSIAQAGIEDAGIAASAADGVPAARPDLDFVAAFFRSGLSGKDESMQ